MMKKAALFLVQALCLMIVSGILFNSGVAHATSVYVAVGGSNANTGFGPANPRATLQEAADDGSPHDTVVIGIGVFNGVVNVNKPLVFIGTGSVIASNAGGSGGVINLSASGLPNNPIVFKDCFVQPTAMAGFSVGTFGGSSGLNVGYINLDNVHIIGTNTLPGTEQERGIYVDQTSSLHHVNMTNCKFNDLHYGWYFHKHTPLVVNMSNVSDIMAVSCQFKHNAGKGIYAEKLSEATINDCWIDGNGYSPSAVAANFRSGADINLKNGNYYNIKFLNCLVTNNGLGAKEGTGITIKARNDGTYSGFPATLTGVLIHFCRFIGNERALRFGEPPPAATNAGPTDVVITSCSFVNNNKTYVGVDGSAYGDVINMTSNPTAIDAKNNWWNTILEPTIMARKSGLVDYSPWLLHDTGDAWFDLGLNPTKPKLTDNFINLQLRLMKKSDSISSIQFDIKAPRAPLSNGDVNVITYNQAGTPISLTNVSKNIIDYDATTTTYRLVVTPAILNAGNVFHTRTGVDTNLYTNISISFDPNGTSHNGDALTFEIMNISATEKNGAPIRFTRVNTRIVRNASISFVYRPSGDINGSGSVNVSDLMLTINHILEIAFLSGPQFQEADLNRNDIVNIADAMLLINIINGVEIPAIISDHLIMDEMGISNRFDVKRAWSVYFTSEEAMQMLTELPNVKNIWWSDNRKAVNVEFSQPTDCEILFASNVNGVRIGSSLVSSVIEDLGVVSQIPALQDINVFDLNGRTVNWSDRLESGTYMYTYKDALGVKMLGKLVLVK